MDQKNKLIGKVDLFLKTTLGNKEIMEHYKHESNRLVSSSYSYLALHLALTRVNKASALTYLLRSIRAYPISMFNRRTFAIIKYIVF